MMQNGLPELRDLDDVQRWSLEKILNEGFSSNPRGLNTKEVLFAGFVLTNPRARRLTSPARNWSEALAIGEFCWHLTGSNDVGGISYYAPAWSAFADADGRVRGSCYGRRIFSKSFDGRSQWELAKELLTSDPNTRRAIIDLQGSLLLHRGKSNDVSCATSIQFLLRDGALNCAVTMRSNDAIWGLPYDVFLFTMLHELMATQLGVELGRYAHFASSLHLYDRHFELAARIIAEPQRLSGEMQAMTDLDKLPAFLRAEEELRLGRYVKGKNENYWSTLESVLRSHAAKAQKLSESAN